MVVDHYGSILQRSIYQPVIRTELHMAELLNAFDFPARDEATGRRQTTTNALQALLLMNGPFVVDQAHHTAQALLVGEETDDGARVRRLYLRVLGRPAQDDEVSASLEFVKSSEASLLDVPEPEVRRNKAWQSLCQAMFMLNEFVYVD